MASRSSTVINASGDESGDGSENDDESGYGSENDDENDFWTENGIL